VVENEIDLELYLGDPRPRLEVFGLTCTLHHTLTAKEFNVTCFNTVGITYIKISCVLPAIGYRVDTRPHARSHQFYYCPRGR